MAKTSSLWYVLIVVVFIVGLDVTGMYEIGDMFDNGLPFGGEDNYAMTIEGNVKNSTNGVTLTISDFEVHEQSFFEFNFSTPEFLWFSSDYKVVFYVDGERVGSKMVGSIGEAQSKNFSYKLRNLKEGSHTVVIQAVQLSNNKTDTETIEITCG